jgi:metallophosphoesterase (TIGR00282 family)
MNILFVGDVVGAPGRRALSDALGSIIDKRKIDFTIVNVENAAGGFGLTVELFEDLSKMPIDVFSSGNHIWDKKEIYDALNASDRLLRPANYPPGNPGRGSTVQSTAAGIPVAVLNLQGQVFMPANADSPFRVADEELARLDARVVVVDMHAEATSEKMAMGWYLDGRVSAVLGTHTHVPTADETILPAPRSFETAKRDIRLSGAVVAVDESTGKATGIERVQVRVD